MVEPRNENKFYERGRGMLEAMSTTGHSEDIQLYTVEHGIRRMSLYGGRVS